MRTCPKCGKEHERCYPDIFCSLKCRAEHRSDIEKGLESITMTYSIPRENFTIAKPIENYYGNAFVFHQGEDRYFMGLENHSFMLENYFAKKERQGDECLFAHSTPIGGQLYFAFVREFRR